MALKTLEDVKEIGGFAVTRGVANFSSFRPVFIFDEKNEIAFKLQDGPVFLKGVNGCQVDTIIETAKLMLEGLNKNLSCVENEAAIGHLEAALSWLAKRKIDREERKVEGTEYI